MYVLVGSSVNIMSIFRSCAGKWQFICLLFCTWSSGISAQNIFLLCVKIYETSAAAVHIWGARSSGQLALYLSSGT